MYPDLVKTIKSLEFHPLPDARKLLLRPLIDYIQARKESEKAIYITFICTHNSRRSQLAQVWMQALAHHYGLTGIYCYSGGTETTAVYPMITDTLNAAGFRGEILAGKDNPVYGLKFDNGAYPIVLFSKQFNHFINPNSEYIAVMTCIQADEECPFIPEADARIPVSYDDPKVFDDTPDQQLKYGERSTQIGAEMSYVIRKVIGF